MNEPIPPAPDQHFLPEIKSHSTEKHRIISLYSSLFTKATRGTWHRRVYLDLFAGAGRASLIRGSKREVVETSPSIAMKCEPMFDKFIFCDKDAKCTEALRKRVHLHFPAAEDRVTILQGDCNELVPQIFRAIPPHGKNQLVLTLCIVDPFCMSNLRFETIRKLNNRFMDFLVLIPDGMDAGRGPNPKYYLQEDSSVIEDFVGDPEWRMKWMEWEKTHPSARQYNAFNEFVVERFSAAMKALGHQPADIGDMVQVRQTGNRSPLYKLALFSKNPLGKHLFSETKKSADPQRFLNFD